MQAQENTWPISKDHAPEILTKSYVEEHMPQGTTHIVIPDNVTSIAEGAFEFCKILQKITIPDSVNSIGEGAFSWCTHLLTVTIPDSVSDLGAHVFRNCHSLKSAVISNQLTCIERHTFDKCKSLECVVLPNDLLQIKPFAFYECENLQKIDIPAKVTHIGEAAFYGCSNLQSTNLSANLTHIDGHSFYNCKNLENIVIPGSVTWIGNFAFERCSKLNFIMIPKQPTEFGNAPFQNCSSAVLPDALCSRQKKIDLGLLKASEREFVRGFVECTPFSDYAREFVITSSLKDDPCKHNDSRNDGRDDCQEKLFQGSYPDQENISLYRLCYDISFQPRDLVSLNDCLAVDVVRAILYRHNNLSLPSTGEDAMPGKENECESTHFLRCVMGSRFITACHTEMINKDPNLEGPSLIAAMIENAPDLEGPNLHLFQCLTLKDYVGVNASSTNSIHDLSIFKYQRKPNQSPTQHKPNHTLRPLA